MSYQVIARKWRPQNFEQLIGQDHVARTLQNALKNNRLPHAILLTGPRGTGKTSTARILAKSLRCQQAVDFVPCNQCSDCLEIATGSSVDVLEVDGASNNGVEAIRELREGVRFMPASGHYRVYIIDEVHMLSTSAFNALLKTLEEPPAHVVFIMATTEVQKLPATILSRCQRFDFRRIPTREIVQHLSSICQAEGFAVDADALWLVARLAEGSMRDSQSLLDQVLTFSEGHLDRTQAAQILGLTSQTLLYDTLAAFIRRDLELMLDVLVRFNKTGAEPVLFIQDVLALIRHVLMLRLQEAQTTSLESLIDLPDSEIRLLKDLGSGIALEELHLLFDMTLKGAQDILRAPEPNITFEMVCLRIVGSDKLTDLKTLINGTAGTAPVKASMPASSNPSATTVMAKATASTPRTPQAVPPSEKWFECVQKIKKEDPLLGAKLDPLIFLGADSGVIRLRIPAQFSFLAEQLAQPEVFAKLGRLTAAHGYPQARIEFAVVGAKELPQEAKSAQKLAQEKKDQAEEELVEQIKQHPKVMAAQKILAAEVAAIRKTEAPNNQKSQKGG